LNRIVRIENYESVGRDGWQPTTGDYSTCRKEGTYVGASNRIKTMILYRADPIPPFRKEEYQRREFTYNADSLPTKVEFHEWHNESSQWLIKKRYNYYYSGTLLDSTVIWKNPEFNHEDFYMPNFDKASYVYNDNKQLIKELHKYEDDSIRYTYTYGGMGVSKAVQEDVWFKEWKETAWNFYQYNRGGYITRYNGEIFRRMEVGPSYIHMSEDYKYYYEYNENGYIDINN